MKVLILGTGNAQVDAIQYCQRRGDTLYGVSYKMEGPGLKLLDYFSEIDILDYECVLQYALANNIELVFSMGSDIALPTIAYVNNQLGLPCFLRSEFVEVLTNKAKFRKYLHRNSFSSIKFKVAKIAEELLDWQTFPAILKPVDSQGQRGLFIINEVNDIARYFNSTKSYSRNGEVIIEEFIDGQEVSINSFIRNGKLVYNFFSDRLSVPDVGVGIVYEHRMPADIPSHVQDRMIGILEQIVVLLKIKDGPLYSQLIWNENDIQIIELTPRLDGCHLWRLIEVVYNIDLLDLSFSLLVKKRNHKLPNSLNINQAHDKLKICYYMHEPNMQFHMLKHKHPNPIYEMIYYDNGQSIKAINGYLEKIGYYITECI